MRGAGAPLRGLLPFSFLLVVAGGVIVVKCAHEKNQSKKMPSM